MEKILRKQIAGFLQLQYPEVIYRFDLGADLRLTIGQAMQNKLLHPYRGYPDIFIAKPNQGYHGLFIELKKEGEKLYKKNGSPKSVHIEEQIAFMKKLKHVGYKAEFCIGFEQTVDTIKNYLKK